MTVKISKKTVCKANKANKPTRNFHSSFTSCSIGLILTLIIILGRMLMDQGDESRPFSCSRCGKPYKSKKAMNTHLRFSCENKRQFFCSVCPAAYFYSHHLKRHMQHQHSKVVATYGGATPKRTVT